MKKLLENFKKFEDSEKRSQGFANKSNETAANTMSAMSVFEEELLEEGYEPGQSNEIDYEVSEADEPDPEIARKFLDSLYSGKRAGFLSPYSIEELSAMNLYLVRGHHAGFAVKPDGDIVSVHNNSNLRRLGSEFMRKAIEVGGTKLDHFDGFLSGLYRKYGFTNVTEMYEWDEQYKPKAWTYSAVDILNPKTSVYSESFKGMSHQDSETSPDLTLSEESTIVVIEGGLEFEIVPKNKFNQYKYGRPDVIFRQIK